MTSTLHFEYADGNGNRYTITPSTLTYIPVKPEESSSGIYSGGSPKSISLTSGEFERISTVLMNAVGNPASHITNRVMMSGAVSVIDKVSRKQTILAPGTVELQDIESTLRELISK